MMNSGIHAGDKVVMTDRYIEHMIYGDRVWTVSTEPQTICDTECVWLDGFDAAYATDGLKKV